MEVEKQRERERVVNERFDPYSGRFFPREPRTVQLASVIQMEQGVENIVRTRTWGLVKERCGDGPDTWEQAIVGWRKKESN